MEFFDFPKAHFGATVQNNNNNKIKRKIDREIYIYVYVTNVLIDF